MSEATQTQSMEGTIVETLRGIQSRVDEELNQEPEQKEVQAELGAGDVQDDPLDSDEHEEAEQTEIQARKAPSAWKKGAAEKFATLDPELQEEIERREADFHKGIESYKSKAAFADEISQVIQPFGQMIQVLGGNPQAVIHNMLVSESVARYGTQQQKVELAQRMLAEYGIDVNSLVNYEAPYVDPQLQNVQSQLAQMQSVLSQQEAARQQAEANSLNSEIQSFAADPAHKHFDGVKAHMSALLLNGTANSLQDAYDQAVWANPQTRQAVLAEQQQAESAARARKAKEAKAAASTNVRKAGTLPAKSGGDAPKSIEDTLRAQMELMRSEGRF